MARSRGPSGPTGPNSPSDQAGPSSPTGGAIDPDGPMRGLVGSGPTRLPPTIAMRARDVAQPTDEDLAEAERTLVLRPARRAADRPAPPQVQDAGDAASGTAGTSAVRS
ncbi:hypothetical protein [Frankia sp. R82]|uniref:hypothetical protein n=1 Tax=Frankia sp. R82 TaxID=2950553 RepID=UPI0020442EAE|nr:hypothetical protein [Frankia sp. R82]MCM3885639.1 hypothetical protein [Frankia sp. R82]